MAARSAQRHARDEKHIFQSAVNKSSNIMTKHFSLLFAALDVESAPAVRALATRIPFGEHAPENIHSYTHPSRTLGLEDTPSRDFCTDSLHVRACVRLCVTQPCCSAFLCVNGSNWTEAILCVCQNRRKESKRCEELGGLDM